MTLDLAAAPIPVLTAERFTLRPVRKSDAGLLGHYAGDLRVARMTSRIPHPMPPGAMDAFVARAMNPSCDEVIWVMDGGEGAEVQGVISLKKMDRDQSEIGYWVAPAFWNTGLASEAVATLIAANPLGNTAIFASVFHDNVGSAKVLTNNGFAYLGDAETFSVARNAHVPTWTYIRKL